MTTSTPLTTSNLRQTVQRVVDDIVRPSAREVDRSGTFPRRGIDALGQAGVLGLLSAADVGGPGLGLREAAESVEQVAAACGSTAMVLLMHYSAVAVLEVHAPREVRQAIARGQHLTTLAFSEAGSHSHFWAPLSTAAQVDGYVRLDAKKSWVTAAGQADSYVWSSRPLAAAGPMTLWLIPADAKGLDQSGGYDGLGLRGNGSTPISAVGLQVQPTAMLGTDGAGLDIALMLLLPYFLVLSAAFSVGLMEAVAAETASYLTSTRLEHLDRTLAQQQVVRMDFARLRLETDRTRTLVEDALDALASSRPDAMLRVLEVKAAAAEAALQVTDMAMKLCGGSAFRTDMGIERRFRDARAARVMAPTTDALLDFIGRVTLGLPLLEEVVAR